MKPVWNECSCCGTHKTGVVKFDDGEQINLTLFADDGLVSAMAVKDGAVFAASSRVPGGFATLVPVDVFFQSYGIEI